MLWKPIGNEFLLDDEFGDRLRKTLYYGKLPDFDVPSLPMTDIAVDYFRESTPRKLDRLNTHRASSISRKASISPCCMMLGMIYIERLQTKNPEYLQHMSSSELFLISMMVASKYLHDEGSDEEVFNDEWAEFGHLELSDINEMEIKFLTALDWEIFVPATDFWRELAKMEREIALQQGSSRGFYTYTDLSLIDVNFHLAQICKLLGICLVAYVAATMATVATITTAVCMLGNRPTFPVSTPAHVSLPVALPTNSSSSLPDGDDVDLLIDALSREVTQASPVSSVAKQIIGSVAAVKEFVTAVWWHGSLSCEPRPLWFSRHVTSALQNQHSVGCYSFLIHDFAANLNGASLGVKGIPSPHQLSESGNELGYMHWHWGERLKNVPSPNRQDDSGTGAIAAGIHLHKLTVRG